MNTWVYVLDTLKPVDVGADRLFTLAEKNPLELFELVRDSLDFLGEIVNVKLRDIYFNGETLELLIEYIVECSLGEISVKLIYSKQPVETIRRYYVFEREK